MGAYGQRTAFSRIVVTIFIEAAPFLLIGSLLGALVEEFGSVERMAHLLPKNTAAGIGLGIVAGIGLPICECGSVPLARRLMRKGIPPHVVLPFMYAAPAINPVVLASTYIAFKGNPLMVLGRVGMILPAAVLIGLLHAGVRSEDILRGQGHGAHGHGHFHSHEPHGGLVARFLSILRHMALDFLDMGRFLLLGAAFSALFRILIPSRALAPLAKDPFHRGDDPPRRDPFHLLRGGRLRGGLLRLLPARGMPCVPRRGPMVDLKRISLYGSTFRRGTALRLIFIPILTVFLCAAVGAWISGVRT